RLLDFDALLVIDRHDKLLLAAAVEEQMTVYVFRLEIEVNARRHDASLQLVARIFDVEQPDLKPAGRLDAVQCLTRCHSERFHDANRSFAKATRRNSNRDVLADEMPAESELATWQCRRVFPLERRGCEDGLIGGLFVYDWHVVLYVWFVFVRFGF